MTTLVDDWSARVAAWGRDEFVTAFPYPFLLSLSGLDEPSPPARTIRIENSPELIAALQAERRRLAQAPDRTPVVLPVRKVQDTFESMITVGRARNNDIIVPGAMVSKFHAFFRQIDGEWT